MNVRKVAWFAALAIFCAQAPAFAQPAKPRPPAKKPAAKPAAKKAEPAPSPKPAPPPAGLHFKTKYAAAGQVTESVTYVQGSRERYELADMILLKQHDQKRTVQISRAGNVYLVTPDASSRAAAPAPEASPAAPGKPPGVVTMTTTIADTGERKTVFGRQARRVTTTIDRLPQPGACDASKLRIETDGWYIDQPPGISMPAADEPPAPAPAASGCADRIEATRTGDPAVFGFPIAYTTTFTDVGAKDAKPVVVSMEITEFDAAPLDPALFEIPAGVTAAANPREWAKAVSDANEAKLASGAPMPGFTRERTPGVVRVGVPEVANNTSEDIDTRALRARLVAELEEQKIEAVPMAAGPIVDLQARAADLGADYLLLAEITELKASQAGRITKLMKTTSGEGAKAITEAKLNVSLVPPDGRPRLATTVSAKEGGVGLKTGLGLAKFAGSLYLRMYMGGMYGNQLGAFGSLRLMKLGGMGSMTSGLGADRTAGAAGTIMELVMTAATAGSEGATSFDAALDGAVQSAGKHVVDTLKKPQPRK